eukprot:scaffold5929_cov72-Phaeocystis_antarctica.AAC.4
MIHSKVHAQLLGKRPGVALLYEGRTPPADKPTLALTLALEVALLRTTCGTVRHVQRVPAEPAMHAAHGSWHGSPLAGYGITLLGVGGCGLAVRTRRPQPRLGFGLGLGLGCKVRVRAIWSGLGKGWGQS